MSALSSRLPHPILDAMPAWCLHNLSSDHPKLVGVVPGTDTVSLQIIDLDADEPLADLAGLAAPPCWELIVVVCAVRWLPLAHGVDRNGHRCTELGAGDTLPMALFATVDHLNDACRLVIGSDADAA